MKLFKNLKGLKGFFRKGDTTKGVVLVLSSSSTVQYEENRVYLIARNTITINPGETGFVETGKIATDTGLVMANTTHRHECKVFPTNESNVLDSSMEGVVFQNRGIYPHTINKGDRVLVLAVKDFDWVMLCNEKV